MMRRMRSEWDAAGGGGSEGLAERKDAEKQRL